MKLIVDIYRSKKKEGLYVYVEKNKPLEELPEALIKQCGGLEHAMVVVLTEQKKLANADTKKVIESIENQAFYLQLPVKEYAEEYMNVIPNDKIPRA